VFPRAVPAVVEKRKADRHRLEAALDELGDEDEVAERLAHLLTLESDDPGVHLTAHDNRGLKVEMVGHCHLLVREDKVCSAALDIDRGAEGVTPDKGTFDVPAGTPRTGLVPFCPEIVVEC